MNLFYRIAFRQVRETLTNKIAGRSVILWNPHHTLSDEGCGTFLIWYPVMMKIFKKRPDIVLIVRPHPLLNKNLRSMQEGNMSLQEFMQFAESNNVIIDTSEEYLDAFCVSDALISDESSLLLEYLPTQKHILFTPKAGRSLLNEDGEELVLHLYIGRTESDLCDFVAMSARNEYPCRKTGSRKLIFCCIMLMAKPVIE